MGRTPRVLFIAAYLLLSGIIGCAAPGRPTPPGGWPLSWSGRQLFYTRGTLVYARRGASADEAAACLAEVNAQFNHRTGGAAAGGLLIVSDMSDNQIGNCDLEHTVANASDTVDSGAKRKRELAKIGIPFEEFALSMTAPVDKKELAQEPGFTAAGLNQIKWAAAMPSDARADQFSSDLIDAGLKSAKLNIFQRILILPLMPFIHNLVNDAMKAERDVALYSCLCKAQSDWTAERCKKEIEAYEHFRLGEVAKSLKATTQQIERERGPAQRRPDTQESPRMGPRAGRVLWEPQQVSLLCDKRKVGAAWA